MRERQKLNDKRIRTLSESGRYGDGDGLYLQISKWGTRSWILRYQIAGKVRDMGLGGFPPITLSQARQRASEARRKFKGAVDPVDPIEMRRRARMAERAEAAKRISFKQCAEKYIASHRAGWKNAKHADQWGATLENYVYPEIGSLSVAAIDTSHIVTILEPIWTAKNPTATRVRGRIELVLDWATARKFRSGENPARWKGHLESLLPKSEKVARVEHHAALPYAEAPAFMEELRALDSVSARALEFTILTAARTSEAVNAQWAEFDLAAKVWTVPGLRMKSSREHRVALSDRAIAILKVLPREKDSPWLFPGGKAHRPLSNMAMLELLRGMREGLTVHGFRSTFRDWAGEETNYPREIAEAALGHVVGDAVERAYRRGDALEKRRGLAEAWSRFLAAPARGRAGNVTPIRRRAK